MKCLVLGGGGFIGSHLCEALLCEGHNVTVLDRPQSHYLNLVESAGATVVRGDFLNQYDLTLAMKDADVLFHLISTTVPQTATNDPVFDAETNLIGTLKLLQEAKNSGIKKIVFSSSGGTVYGIPQSTPIKEKHPTYPINAYGIHKLAIEKYLHLFWILYELEYCVLRVANVYGERQPIKESQGVIPAFLSNISQGDSLKIWGDGSIIRDYIHVSDVVNAFVQAMSYQEPTGIFNIGSGRGHSLNQVIEIIGKITGKAIEVDYSSGRSFDVSSNVLDISSARQEFMWEPRIGIEMGIKRMYKWMLNGGIL